MWRERVRTKSLEDSLPEEKTTDSASPNEVFSCPGEEESSIVQEEGVASLCESDDQAEVMLRLSKEDYDKCMRANELLASFVTALSKTEQSSLCET